MERFNWNDFFSKKEKIAINVQSLEEEQELFEIFNKHGLSWCNGELYEPKSYLGFKEYKNKTCYSNRGTYGTTDLYKGYKFKIYKYKDIKQILNEPKGIFEWLC